MSESLHEALNRCFMRFEDRAERFRPQQIVDTFVAVGPILDVLANRSHQVIYGRRGVGKTHALRYFENQANREGDLAIYIDCSNLGSSNSVYNDTTLSLSERATRLLVDVCITMHWAFMDAFSDPRRGWSLSEVAPLLNDFASAATETNIEGPVTWERHSRETTSSKSGVEVGGRLDLTPEVSAKLNASDQTEEISEEREKREGTEVPRVNFQYLTRVTQKIAQFIAPKRVWLLIDEWSALGQDVQPYLADLIRRSFFGISNVSVKIAAIEQRSAFRIGRQSGSNIGIELGADAAVALNLDDYLVFDANPERSLEVFRQLLRNHVMSISNELGRDLGEAVYGAWTSYAFTNERVFVELVQASEGVPRDAMHILAAAAQRAMANPVSAPIIRTAALMFFQTEKLSAVIANPINRKMLDWIRFKVIDERNTRNFLLQVGVDDKIINDLFDLRVLHVLNRSMSAAHRPGERYIVYKIDYGCYVDLTNTKKPPTSLVGTDGSYTVDFDVPEDDKRSYRRSILDLAGFYESQKQGSLF